MALVVDKADLAQARTLLREIGLSQAQPPLHLAITGFALLGQHLENLEPSRVAKRLKHLCS